MIVFEVLAILGALIGGLLLIGTVMTSLDNSIAMAAGAAVAIGLAVIPYCFVSVLQRRQMRVDLDRDQSPPA